jgi:hypothetical protein
VEEKKAGPTLLDFNIRGFGPHSRVKFHCRRIAKKEKKRQLVTVAREHFSDECHPQQQTTLELQRIATADSRQQNHEHSLVVIILAFFRTLLFHANTPRIMLPVFKFRVLLVAPSVVNQRRHRVSVST